MPFAEGPIDVDRQVDWDLANRIVAAREGGPLRPPTARPKTASLHIHRPAPHRKRAPLPIAAADALTRNSNVKTAQTRTAPPRAGFWSASIISTR